MGLAAEVTMNPCPACGSMLREDGTCTNNSCESYDTNNHPSTEGDNGEEVV